MAYEKREVPLRFASGLATILALFLAAMGFQSPAVAATFNVSDVAGLRTALLTAATNGEDMRGKEKMNLLPRTHRKF